MTATPTKRGTRDVAPHVNLGSLRCPVNESPLGVGFSRTPVSPSMSVPHFDKNHLERLEVASPISSLSFVVLEEVTD